MSDAQPFDCPDSVGWWVFKPSDPAIEDEVILVVEYDHDNATYTTASGEQYTATSPLGAQAGTWYRKAQSSGIEALSHVIFPTPRKEGT
jgi:hypothetical protein